MEKHLAIFPRNGKKFSTVWKSLERQLSARGLQEEAEGFAGGEEADDGGTGVEGAHGVDQYIAGVVGEKWRRGRGVEKER